MKKSNTKFANKGFTLIELVLTVAILAFGIVSIYEALFVSVDTYGYYKHYLNTQDWINEKIWEVQEELMVLGVLNEEQTTGQILRDYKKFVWLMDIVLLDETQSLYRVNLELNWHEGKREVSTSREVYLMPLELREHNEGKV